MQNIESKKRYDILDGLRGVAAVLVVISHICESYVFPPILGTQLVGHAHLAVDFFFALSGFVIAYAYDDCWGQGMGYLDFFKRRLIRLHPLVILGSTLGFVIFLLAGTWAFPQLRTAGDWTIAMFFVFSLLMIPCPAGKTGVNLNPFNGPNWSLSYEYVANILYAFVFRRFGKKTLMAAVAIAGFFSIALICKWDLFGFLEWRTRYSVIGGMSISPTSCYIAFTRLLFPFLMGMLVCRLRFEIKIPNGFWWCILALVFFVAFPRDKIGLPPAQQLTALWNIPFEICALFIAFPLILVVGAGSEIIGEKANRFCKFLGDLSYPLYMTHYPFVYVHHAWAKNYYASIPPWAHFAIGVAFVAFTIVFAVFVDKFYDTRVRKWLSRKR